MIAKAQAMTGKAIAIETTKTIEHQTNTFNKYMDIFIEKLPSIIIGLIILLIGIIIAKIVKRILNRMLHKYKTSMGVISFLINLVQFTIIIIAALQCLSAMGINTTSFAAVLGAAGFGVGLAFKEVLSNFGACLIILFFKPYQIGDYILCNGIEGTICEIEIFSTTLKTVDNKLIVLPNSLVTTNPVTNYTAHNMRRIDFVFSVEYDTDIKLLYSIAEKIFSEDKRILKDPAPLIGIDSMENNIIKFIAKPWVKTDDYWDVYYSAMEKFKESFDSHKIVLSRINVVSK